MYILTLSHFLAEVVYTPELENKFFLKFFTTKLQPHSLKVSSKKKSFSMPSQKINQYLTDIN